MANPIVVVDSVLFTSSALIRRQSSVLQLTQEVRNLWLGPVNGADKLAAHHSTAIDDVGLRPPECPIQFADFLVRVAHREQIHIVIFHELPVSILVHIDAHSQHSHAFRFHASLHLDQRRNLFYARRAPRGPKIQHHNLTMKLGESNLGLGIPHAEIGRARANTRWTRTAVTGTEAHQQKKNEDHTGKTTDAAHGSDNNRFNLCRRRKQYRGVPRYP